MCPKRTLWHQSPWSWLENHPPAQHPAAKPQIKTWGLTLAICLNKDSIFSTWRKTGLRAVSDGETVVDLRWFKAATQCYPGPQSTSIKTPNLDSRLGSGNQTKSSSNLDRVPASLPKASGLGNLTLLRQPCSMSKCLEPQFLAETPPLIAQCIFLQQQEGSWPGEEQTCQLVTSAARPRCQFAQPLPLRSACV